MSNGASRSYKLGTRGSLLATTQSQWFADQLTAANPHNNVELEIIKTTGDDLSISLMAPAVPGAFVNALRQKLIEGEVDFIVHSLKDLPSSPHPELSLAAIPVRADHRDVLVSFNNVALRDLPAGAVVGTSSPRRMAALKELRPDLLTSPIRGNIDSRISKVRSGEYAAAILAAAGIARIDRLGEIAEYFDVDFMIPAPAQGALGVECRSEDLEMQKLLASVDHPETRLTATAERAVLRGLNAGCDLAIGAYASIETNTLSLRAELGDIASGVNQKLQASAELASLQDYAAAEQLGLDLARRFVR